MHAAVKSFLANPDTQQLHSGMLMQLVQIVMPVVAGFDLAHADIMRFTEGAQPAIITTTLHAAIAQTAMNSIQAFVQHCRLINAGMDVCANIQAALHETAKRRLKQARSSASRGAAVTCSAAPPLESPARRMKVADDNADGAAT